MQIMKAIGKNLNFKLDISPPADGKLWGTTAVSFSLHFVPILYNGYPLDHRVGRVVSFFSSRRNWDSPNPPPAGECVPHPLIPGEGAYSLAREGVGESQFQRGDIQHKVVLFRNMYFVLLIIPSAFGRRKLFEKHKKIKSANDLSLCS